MNLIREILFISILFVAVACSDDSITTIQTGSITGFAYLYDEALSQEITNHENIEIIIEGSKFSTTTDSSGKWEINNIPQGIYDIKFSKENYSTLKEQAFQFLGNGTASLGNTTLRKLPEFDIISLSDSTVDDKVNISVSIIDTTNYKEMSHYVRYFIGRTDSVKANSPFYTFQDIIYIPSGMTDISFLIFKSDFEYYGFQSGEKLYLIVYPAKAGVPLPYTDIYTGIRIYPTLGKNPSEVIEIVVP